MWHRLNFMLDQLMFRFTCVCRVSSGLRSRLWKGVRQLGSKMNVADRTIVTVGGDAGASFVRSSGDIGFSLIDSAGEFRALMKRVKLRKIDWLHLSLPRDTLIKGQRNNFRSEMFVRGCPNSADPGRVTRANLRVTRLSKLARAQALTGGWVSVAGPVRSFAWQFTGLRRLKRLMAVQELRLDSCGFEDGPPWREQWLTNAAWLAACSTTCEDLAAHQHHQRSRRTWTQPSKLLADKILVAFNAAALPPRIQPARRLLSLEAADDELENKRQRRAREEAETLGGLRRPHLVRKKLTYSLEAAKDVRAIIDGALEGREDTLLKDLPTLGKQECPESFLLAAEDVRRRLHAWAGTNGSWDERLDGELVHHITEHMKDPDVEVVKWVQGQTPLGISCGIVDPGIFPPSDSPYESGVDEYVSMNGDWDNYTSYAEHQVGAEELLRQDLANKRLRWFNTYQEMKQAAGGDVTLSKIGVIAKQKAEKMKLRLVHDLRRSGKNDEVKVDQRVVLPRLMDVVEDGLAVTSQVKDKSEYDHLCIDFSDAFKQLLLDEREWRHVGGAALGGFFFYIVLLFGIRSGPLVWGRVAAWLMRVTVAVFSEASFRLECYVDDPFMTAAGPLRQRRLLLSKVMVFWMSLGFKLAWDKGSLGQQVEWIGAVVRPWMRKDKWHGFLVTLSEKRCKELASLCAELLALKLVPKGRLRALAGLASWMSGLLPQLNPFCRMIWAALKSDSHPGGVHQQQVALPLRWLQRFSANNMENVMRRCRLVPRYFTLLCFDGSPTGGGATLSIAATSRNAPPHLRPSTQVDSIGRGAGQGSYWRGGVATSLGGHGITGSS